MDIFDRYSGTYRNEHCLFRSFAVCELCRRYERTMAGCRRRRKASHLLGLDFVEVSSATSVSGPCGGGELVP
jgi:hypothetical protein